MLSKIDTEVIKSLMETNGKSETVRSIELKIHRCYSSTYTSIMKLEALGILKTNATNRNRSVELTSKGISMSNRLEAVYNVLST